MVSGVRQPIGLLLDLPTDRNSRAVPCR